jgi:beta-glucosidase
MRDAARLNQLLARLTVAEKLDLVRGQADPTGTATGYLAGVERLGLPPLRFVDGPLGIADGPATGFPATLALGATWNPTLARRVGTALGRECRAHGHDVLLAPGLNIIRVPTGGRNFEYLSEDPHHCATLGAAYIEGVESTGVGATAKHFVANNQEQDRDVVDVVVSERTLREVYLPAFRAAVAADVSAVMTAYNQVNGTQMSAHRRLLREVLREEWGFEGITVSDWWGTHDTVGPATGGLDIEMPGVSPVTRRAPTNPGLALVAALDISGRLGLEVPLHWQLIDRLVADDGQPDPYPPAYFGADLRAAIDAGRVTESTLDRKARRVLALYDSVGLLDGSRATPPEVDADAHHALACQVATHGTVLLANDGLLPLDEQASLAVLGPGADRAKIGGGGSSAVRPRRRVSPTAGLADVAASVQFERGVSRVREPSPAAALRERVRPSGRPTGLAAARDAASEADVAVVVVEDAATESEDRSTMALPGAQDRLVRTVAAVNPRTVVVARTSGAVRMPWLDAVSAVVQAWYPGQADGTALADVLYGRDPGGRLPVTFGHQFDDYPVATERRYPGVDRQVHYEEGVLVGYRWFDAVDVTPAFPFGHGLSYGEFAYDTLTADRTASGLSVAVSVTNTADRPAREVVQLYASPPTSAVDRPRRELVGFESLRLAPGEQRQVSLSVPHRALARYAPDTGWVVDAGGYELAAGRSSRDLRVQTTIQLDRVDGPTGGLTD